MPLAPSLRSYGNNAVQNDYTDYHHQDTAQVEDFQDWKAHRIYNICEDGV